MSNPSVYLTHSAVALPNAPVDNDTMEAILGQVAGIPSRARRTVLRSNGIQRRFYAVDPLTGTATHTNAQLTAEAVRALQDTGASLEAIDCLACGTTLPDQLMPNHAVMVHGELALPVGEVMSAAGICVSGMTAFKYAWMAIRCGQARKAVATGSEISSAIMRGARFDPEAQYKVEALEQRPEIAFEKDFLRWMLSDGAGAWMLQDQPRSDGVSLRVEWVEMASYAHEEAACMYAGAEKQDDGSLRGWLACEPDDVARRSLFAVKQDVRQLNDNVVRYTLEKPLARLIAKHGLQADHIDWLLPHISSEYFREPVARGFRAAGLEIPQQRWFTNLSRMGNTGSASAYIMLHELLHSGQLQRGQRILLFVPESGRFSSSFTLFTVV